MTAKVLTEALTPKSNGPSKQETLDISNRQRQIELHPYLVDLKKKLGKRYIDCQVDTYEISDNLQIAEKQRVIVEKLKKYRENLQHHVEAGEGLIFYGRQGTGKDHLMAAMLLYAAHTGYKAKLMNGIEMYRGVSETWGTDAKESDRLKELTAPDILGISDPLSPTGSLKDYQANFLYSVLDERYRRMKPTWMTANFFGGSDAEERLSSQIADRIKDGSLTLYFDWPSYRKSLTLQ